jgi:hypothetical protein
MVFAVLWGLGLLPTVANLSPPWKAFGLGLLFPGAGFLYTSDPVFFALVLATLPYVFVIRFQFRADHVTPAAIVLAAAAGASLRTHSGLWEWALWAVPAALVLAIVAFRVGRRRAFNQAKTRAASRNALLATVRPPHPDRHWPPAVVEHSTEDLAVLDGFLDMALQRRDQWDGFDWRDQYSMASMRYQLNWLQWSLALATYTCTPAFTGYVAKAQANLIERMTDRRVWSYWRRENAWGNFDLDPDPIARDNIMLSGYLALMLGLYALTTGDRRFDHPGALTFRWSDGKVFPYSALEVFAAVEDNFTAAPWGLFPCEPGLNFAGCNAIALMGLAAADRAYGTDRAAALEEPFRRTLDEEYTTVDGEIISIISRRWGYGMRFVHSPVVQAGQAVLLRALAPDVADRTWAIVREELFGSDGMGLTSLSTDRYDTDMGTNKRSPATRLAFAWALAAEMGDDEAVAHARAAAANHLRLDTVAGVARYANASAYANATLGLARFGRADTWYQIINGGVPDAWRTGPRLAAAPSPEVRVARAVSDGQSLELVLRHGRAGPGRRRLAVDRLDPGRAYRITGAVEAAVRADAGGCALLEVDVEDRREVRLIPDSR